MERSSHKVLTCAGLAAQQHGPEVRPDALNLHAKALHRDAPACKNVRLPDVWRIVGSLEVFAGFSRIGALDGHVTSIYRRVSFSDESQKHESRGLDGSQVPGVRE
jgi:hypothetical protein